MGRHLNQRYQLDDVVGTGGMGSVHRAVDIRLGRTVAIKLLKGGADADVTDRARMRSEAQLAASIRHPGVAQVYDYDEDTSSHATFIVMEYVDGHTLAQVLRERGPLPVDQVMSVVQQVAEGLQAAHDLGIVHRDLKPANIMLTPAGRTVLVDFGIARTDTSDPLTDTGSLVGTADYMSPEQAQGRGATPRSDLYSLGVVAYQCLTGVSPFRRDSHVATAFAQVHDDLPPFDDDVPPRVARLISALTAKDPDERPASAADVAREAASIGAAGTIDMPPTFEMLAPASATPVDVTPVPTSVPDERRRRPGWLVAALALLLVLAGVTAWQALADEPPVVPDVVGVSVADATAEVRDAGLSPRTRLVDVAGHAEGQVVKQTPEAGATAEEDDRVDLLVASGKVRVAAKDVIGRPYDRAAAALERLGLVVRRDEVTRSTDLGDVVALDKSGRLASGDTVTLSVAVAPPVSVATGGGAASTGGSKAAPAKKSKGGNNGSGPGANSGKAKGKGKGKGKRN